MGHDTDVEDPLLHEEQYESSKVIIMFDTYIFTAYSTEHVCTNLQESRQNSRKKRINHSIIPRVLAYKEFTGKSVKFTRRIGIEQNLLDIADAENDVRKLSLNSNAVRAW